MAIKYDSGVIACADSRNLSIIKAPHQEEYTLSTELLIRSISFMIILSFLEVELQDNLSKLLTKSGISSILMSTSKVDYPM